MTIGLDEIREAASLLDGRVARTPTIASEPLSRLTGAELLLKLENLQPTSSFKVRGALVRLSRLDAAARAAGVVAASAGNHAQGVAYHAGRLRIPATIVMPRGTPYTKIGRTRALGARVVLHGEDLSAAQAHARDLERSGSLTFVHPYDDADVIAGQGTIGLEMLADAPGLDVLVVPIGGGGLIAGVATAVKALKPSIEIVGVQSALYPAMRCALRDEPLPNIASRTIAEGIAVKEPGVLTRAIIADLVDEVALVDEGAIERAVYAFLDMQRLVVEGAAAAGLAAVMTDPKRYAGRRVGLVVCGGNIDSLVLTSILQRGLARDGRLVHLRIGLPDAPGVLARIAGIIGDQGANIVEVFHRRLFLDVPVKMAEIDVEIEAEGPEHVEALMKALSEGGFPVRMLAETGGNDQS